MMAEIEEILAISSSGNPNYGQETDFSPISNDPPDDSVGKEEKEEEQEKQEGVFRRRKRRKLCPSALESSTAFDLKNGGFSEEISVPCFTFSFDTKVNPIESTPKFGSFNFTPDLDFGPSDFTGFSFGSEVMPEKGSVREEVGTTVVAPLATGTAGSIVAGASLIGGSVQSGEED